MLKKVPGRRRSHGWGKGGVLKYERKQQREADNLVSVDGWRDGEIGRERLWKRRKEGTEIRVDKKRQKKEK